MSEMNRREALGLLALVPLAPLATAARAHADASVSARKREGRAPELKFFTPHEYATVVVLADLVIPADERSGSASDAGAPEFIDFVLSDVIGAGHREPIRGGLAWLDAESRRRHERKFVDLTGEERTGILDDIAWPARARPEMSHGVSFFSRFRDLVASGFWSTEMGVEDLRYIGNVAVPNWNGCPPEALRALGVSYPA